MCEFSSADPLTFPLHEGGFLYCPAAAAFVLAAFSLAADFTSFSPDECDRLYMRSLVLVCDLLLDPWNKSDWPAKSSSLQLRGSCTLHVYKMYLLAL